MVDGTFDPPELGSEPADSVAPPVIHTGQLRGLLGNPISLGRVWSLTTSGPVIFLVSSVWVNGCNFVFHLILSRLLGPGSYGALSALLNVTAVASLPLSAVQVIMAQSVVRRSASDSDLPLRMALTFGLAISIVLLVGWLAATPLIDGFFHLHSARPTLVLGLWVVPSVGAAILEGVLLGQRRFRLVGLGHLVGTGAGRLFFGVLFTVLGFGVTGGVLATVLASTVLFVVFAVALWPHVIAPGRFLPGATEAAISTIAIGGVGLLTSIDAWLARHFLSAMNAGLFTAASTAGRITLFLPGAITVIYFPRIASAEGKGTVATRALMASVVLVGVLSLGSAGVMAAFPRLTVSLLFGNAFLGTASVLGTVAFADAGIAIAGAFVYFLVANRSKLAFAPLPCCGIALVLAQYFHSSVEILALDMVAATWTLVLMTAVASLYKGHLGRA